MPTLRPQCWDDVVNRSSSAWGPKPILIRSMDFALVSIQLPCVFFPSLSVGNAKHISDVNCPLTHRTQIVLKCQRKQSAVVLFNSKASVENALHCGLQPKKIDFWIPLMGESHKEMSDSYFIIQKILVLFLGLLKLAFMLKFSLL